MSKNKHHQKKRESSSPALAIIKGLAVSAICAVSMITLAAIIVYSTADPASFVLPAALAALYISCFAGGLASSLSYDGDVLCGVMSGAAVFVIIILLSLLLPGGASERVGTGISIALHAVSILFAFFGALAASSISRRHTKRRRRR
ncbi:MAG: hypothetical protein IJY27_02025 [Clostridia bacterium]|nr:hypothetical protein [Clostridia bacterium]